MFYFDPLSDINRIDYDFEFLKRFANKSSIKI
jgi:hypothetical protein